MPTIDERFDSRPAALGESPTAELRYVVQGTEDDAEVKSLVALTAPLSYAGLRRQSIRVEPLGGGIWDAGVQYGRRGSEPQFTFDTGGGTAHLTHSLQTVERSSAPGHGTPDFQQAIGVNEDRIEGTDVTIPVFNFTETHYFAPEVVDDAFKAVLYQLTGRVNHAAWRNFGIGEVLFLGASGSQRGEEDWEITFRFAASPTVELLEIGAIVVELKLGWEYLWVRFADAVDEDAQALVKRPTAAYVEQVYEFGDFSLLGIDP